MTKKAGVLKLGSLFVELKCPKHGLERFNIKVVRRFNMKNDTIKPKFRTRTNTDELSRLLVGKNVCDKEIKDYLTHYFREKGLMEAILKMKLV